MYATCPVLTKLVVLNLHNSEYKCKTMSVQCSVSVVFTAFSPVFYLFFSCNTLDIWLPCKSLSEKQLFEPLTSLLDVRSSASLPLLPSVDPIIVRENSAQSRSGDPCETDGDPCAADKVIINI